MIAPFRQRTIAACNASAAADIIRFPRVRRPVDCTDAARFPAIAAALDRAAEIARGE